MLGSMLHGDIGIRYNLTCALSEDFVTQDFFSYFSVSGTKDSGMVDDSLYIVKDLL